MNEDESIMLYIYCSNSSISFLDFHGTSIVGAVVTGGAIGAAILAVVECAKPQVELAKERYQNSGDKFKHCWVSCRISKTCGALIMEIAGLGKEVFDRGVHEFCKKFPENEYCQENKTTPFWDSIKDLEANQQCAGWEPFVFGAVGGWIGAAFRDSCEDCCRCKVGFNAGER